MKKIYLLTRSSSVILALLITFSLSSQEKIWTNLEAKKVSQSPEMALQVYQAFSLEHKVLKKVLNKITFKEAGIIDVPLPDGEIEQFIIKKSTVMHPDLAAKYPQIQTYSGTSVTNSFRTIGIDYTPQGFKAMIVSPEGNVLVDPYAPGDNERVISYFEKDYEASLSADELKQHYGVCEKDHSEDEVLQIEDYEDNLTSAAIAMNLSSGSELSTYRLAITCSGEYSQWHINREGGGIKTVLAAVVSTMNRVNTIFKREAAINLVLIPEQDQLIFLDPDTDPFATNCGNTLNFYQSELLKIINENQFDIGHHFCVGGGGVAGTGPCIQNRKAVGRSGSGFPSGAGFASLVGHEMGHQFSAGHTFSGTQGNCNEGNRSRTSGYEVGSGSTIMSYYGICGSDNLRREKGAYYHTRSYEQMTDFIRNTGRFGGGSCATVTETGNTPPVADAGNGGWTIPISTPFILSGSGSDVDVDDELTYCWEQYDLGTPGPPGNPQADGPLFRSYSPTVDSFRVFPRLEDLVSNTSDLGETLPATTRSMTFRLTVRDNFAEGGGVNFDALTMNVTAEAGPFQINVPNTAVTYDGGSNITVEWDVANTDQAPVNTSLVNILLSIDGGFTYPFTLASNVSNNGSANVRLTNVASTTARIKVESVGNVFFDISNTDFTIIESALPTFSLTSTTSSITLCAGESEDISVDISSILGFTDPVELRLEGVPSSIQANLSTNTITPAGNVTISLQAGNEQEIGEGFSLVGVGGEFDIMKKIDFTVDVVESPTLDPINNVILCDGRSEIVTANASSSEINWYDSPQLGTPIFVGESLTVDDSFLDQTIFVTANGSTVSYQVGPEDNEFNSGSQFNNNIRGLIVDVFRPIRWETAIMYAGAAGEREIAIENGVGGPILLSKTVNLTQGENLVEIDLDLEPGTDYHFTINSDLVDLYRNNRGAVYPYEEEGVISIKESSAGSPGFYYWFYNMIFSSTVACNSEPVSFTVSDGGSINRPVITSTDDLLSVSGNYDTYQWFFNGNEIVGATSPTYQATQEGDYTVVVTANNGCQVESETFTILLISVNEEQNRIFSLIPNPAKDQVVIQLEKNLDDASYELIDLNGKILDIASFKREKIINLSSYQSGVYVVKVNLNDEVITKRLTIE